MAPCTETEPETEQDNEPEAGRETDRETECQPCANGQDEVNETITKRVMIRDWISYYLAEFRFVSDYAESDETTSSVLGQWLERYGLGSTLKKTQDGTLGLVL